MSPECFHDSLNLSESCIYQMIISFICHGVEISNNTNIVTPQVQLTHDNTIADTSLPETGLPGEGVEVCLNDGILARDHETGVEEEVVGVESVVADVVDEVRVVIPDQRYQSQSVNSVKHFLKTNNIKIRKVFNNSIILVNIIMTEVL